MNVSARTRVELPAHIPPEFEVYINGVRQEPGRDFQLEGQALVFPRPLAEEGKSASCAGRRCGRDRRHVSQA